MSNGPCNRCLAEDIRADAKRRGWDYLVVERSGWSHVYSLPRHAPTPNEDDDTYLEGMFLAIPSTCACNEQGEL